MGRDVNHKNELAIVKLPRWGHRLERSMLNTICTTCTTLRKQGRCSTSTTTISSSSSSSNNSVAHTVNITLSLVLLRRRLLPRRGRQLIATRRWIRLDLMLRLTHQCRLFTLRACITRGIRTQLTMVPDGPAQGTRRRCPMDPAGNIRLAFKVLPASSGLGAVLISLRTSHLHRES